MVAQPETASLDGRQVDQLRDALATHFLALTVLIMLIALALRLAGVGSESFWVDEEWSRGAANSGSLAEVVQRCIDDVHPPFYFTLLYLWRLAFGDGDVALRLLSVAFGTLTVGAGALAGRALWDARTGLLGAVAIAVAADLVRYSQEARMYALVSLLAVLLLGVAVRVSRRPSAWWWVALGLGSLMLMLTHNYGVGVVGLLFIGTAIALRSHGKSLRPLIVTFIATAGAYALLWLPSLLGQLDFYLLEWLRAERPSLRDVISVIAGVFLWEDAPAVVAMAVAAATLALYGWGVARTWGSDRWMLLLLTVAPVIGMAIIAHFKGMWLSRSFAFVWPIVALAVARGILQLPSRALAVAAVVLLFGASLWASAAHLQGHQKQQWQEAAQLVAEEARPDDQVIVTSEIAWPSFVRYYSGSPLNSFYLEREPDWAEVERACALTQQTHSRLWFVDANGPQTLRDHLMARPDLRMELDRNFVRLRVFRFAPN